MTYYLDIINSEESDFTSSGVLYDSKGNVVNEIFDEGKSLKELNDEKFTIIINEETANVKGKVRDKIAAFVQDAGSVFILSQNSCQFLKDYGITNLEYFDLTIKGKGLLLKSHKLVNVVSQKFDCINKKKSQIEYRKNGNIKYIDYLELDESKIPKDQAIFLLAGFQEANIFMRDELVKEIQKHLTGFKLKPVNEFTI